ncbi:uncharacterized protein LOC134225564 [Armigeres subalbatus]|uniref:uncharacterized protein LOC134225564 n=1 Tax=Armigeres subalbatus TaxID=124917 RepID=UPI002ED6770D
MTSTIVLFTAILLGVLVPNHGQENVQTRVAPSLLECYENANIFERDNRLPMTMNILIELIRKVEDSPEFNQDMRQLSIALLHRFRQDGIVRASGVQNIPGVLPFSPVGFHFTKHRILFSRLLPGNAQTFPNATLTAQERCALHFMLSSSIDMSVRGDENVRCAQLSQYRAARVPREISSIGQSKLKSNFLGDIEMLSQPEMNQIRKQIKKMKHSARLEMDPEEEPLEAETDNPEAAAAAEEEQEAEVSDVETKEHRELTDDAGLVDIATNAISACPVENGVVYTRWGSLAAGTVLAGIAAGLEPQTIQLRDLIHPRSSPYRARQQVTPMRVENQWAATLAGDLSEVTLLHFPPQPANIQVGASGAWNSTVAPRWYFLSQRTALEMTDAEIRAGIDGLALATNIIEWRNRLNTLRLSQVLDMYYSPRGVFNQSMRSCNRNDLFTTVAPIQTMRDQATAFSNILEREMQMAVTLQQDTIVQLSASAADALATYVPSSLNDLSCEATAITPNDRTIWRTAADLFIYVDSQWAFQDVYSVVSHLLDELDVGRFGTTYTILNAFNGEVLVNATQFLVDFHTNYTHALHITQPAGLNLPTVLRSVREQINPIMLAERQNNSMSGRSKIALIIPNTATVSEGDSNFAIERLQILREEVPDLRFLYLAGGSSSRFNQFVEESRDVFQMREVGSGAVIDNVNVQTTPVIQRIQQEPRRIVNPRCGNDWIQSTWGSNTINQYVEPQGIVFYRLRPNYFFQQAETRRLRIQGSGFATITVCHSRWVQLPRSNATQNADSITCRTIGTETIDIDLSNACDGHSVIHTCQPLFFSVEFTQLTEVTNLRCTERECRFPDSARFAVVVENLGCFSSAGQVLGSLVLLLAALISLFVRQ